MKKIIFTLIVSIIGLGQLSAQETSGYFYGQDLFRFSKYTNYGTARVQGMGGAFVALGGDATSSVVNPAGLGFYNRNEFSFSPVFRNNSNTANYIGVDNSLNSSLLSIGEAAAVFSRNGVGTRKRKKTFAISYHSLVNFNNDYEYKGINKVSSVQDYFAQAATARGANSTTLDGEFNTATGIASSPEALYYQAFTIEPVTNGYVVFEEGLPVDQLGRVTEKGNLGQFNLSFANNFDDKTYVGVSVGIQNLSYSKIDYIDEIFSNARFLNGLRSTNELIVNGTGINIAVGGIYRLSDDINLGGSITSPTFMGTRESYQSTINIDPIAGALETQFPTVSTNPNDFNYRFTSPLRANAGLSYFLPQKLGVISGEIEYVGYGRMGITDPQNSVWSNEQKAAINKSYNDVVNIKIGGELRVKSIGRIRAGYNRLGDAQDFNDGVNRATNVVSFGGGLRSGRFFADAVFRSSKSQSSFTPYVLNNETDYSSVLVNNRLTSMTFTLGAFF